MSKEKRNVFSDVEDGGLNPARVCGIFSSPSLEDVVDFIAAPCEKVIRHGDSWIVLGRDRKDTRASGYGGRGDRACFSVDIVVGRTPYHFNEDSDFDFVNPNFLSDAARIFLSQKTNLDEYFSVRTEDPSERGKSGIGLKADVIRIVSRGSIKLITSLDEKNSRGGEVNKRYGIELVSGDEHDKLQPMVLGKNAGSAIESVLNSVDQLSTILADFIQIYVLHLQQESLHTHFSPFFGLPTTPSEVSVLTSATTSAEVLAKISTGIAQLKMNIAKIQMNYLSESGSSNIFSPLNKTN